MFRYLLCIALSFSISSFANDGRKRPIKAKYQVVSDIENLELLPGTCKVFGYVKIYDVPVTYAEIATLDKTKSASTNQDGYYELMLSENDTSIFCFAKYFDEIVIWNYLFQSQHEVQIDFFPEKDEKNDRVKKPVIYLYNESSINVNLRVNFAGNLTFVYPELNEKNSWEVQIDANNIYTQHQQKIPYLFWEGDMEAIQYNRIENGIPGFFIATDSVTTFLENTLTALGFTQKEKTDFITFWTPALIQDKYALIQFLIDDECDKIADLEVNPLPTTMRRVYMIYQLSDNRSLEHLVIQPNLTSFDRHGFTLVEWGGCLSQEVLAF